MARIAVRRSATARDRLLRGLQVAGLRYPCKCVVSFLLVQTKG